MQKKIVFISSCIAVVLAFYCYNPFELYFQNDDFIHIPLSAKGIFLQQNTFRPVCDLSIMLDYHLWGTNAWGYHLHNLLLHIIASVILFFFTRLLLKRFLGLQESFILCSATSALFFIYAMHSEPVLWILGRSAILGAIFSLSFLYCYIRKNKSYIYTLGYIVSWGAGLLTYESVWILPLLCAIISIAEIRMNRTSFKKEVLHLSGVFISFIIYLVIRQHYIHEILGSYDSDAIINGDYLLLVKHYILLCIRSFVPAFINNSILVSVFILLSVSILFLSFYTRKESRMLAIILFACFLISLLPYISLGIDTNGTEAERFLYFPTIIVTILTGTIIYSTAQQKLAYLLYPVLFTCHLLILYIVTGNYRTAGNINKEIAIAIKKTGNPGVIYASGVPQAQYGAFILRQGLDGMIRWIAEKTPDTVITCSQRSELLPLHYPYKILFSDSLTINCNTVRGKNVIPGRDTMVLVFTDTALYISRP